MTIPPVMRSASPPAASNPADQPARVGQVRAAADLQAPAPLRRRTDPGRSAGTPPRNAAPSDRAASPGSPWPASTSPLPSLREELSLPSLRVDPSTSGDSVQGPARSTSSTGASRPHAQPLDDDRNDRAVVPAPAKDVEAVEAAIAMLGEMAAGRKVLHLRRSGVHSSGAFTMDGQLKPRHANIDAAPRRFHERLDRLRAGTPQDRALLTRLDEAMLHTGRQQWQRTADVLDGLIEGSELLQGGFVTSKDEIVDDLYWRELPHVARAVERHVLVNGIVKTPGRVRIERLRASAEHADTLARWDALQAAQRSSRAPAPAARTRPAPLRRLGTIDLDRRAHMLATYTLMLGRMARDEARLMPLSASTELSSFAAYFDVEGGLKESGRDFVQPLRDGDSVHRQAVADMEQASLAAVQAHRERTAGMLQDLADAIIDIKSGRLTKGEATRALAARGSKARNVLKDAIDKDGFPALSPSLRKRADGLLARIDRARGSSTERLAQAARRAHAALHAGERPTSPGDRAQHTHVAQPEHGTAPARGRLAAAPPTESRFELPDLATLPMLEPISLPGSPASPARPAGSPGSASADAPRAPPAVDARALRSNATRDWVLQLTGSWPVAYRQALVERAVTIERSLTDRHAPPLRDMLEHGDRRLLSLLGPEQAETITQLEELLRPPGG